MFRRILASLLLVAGVAGVFFGAGMLRHELMSQQLESIGGEPLAPYWDTVAEHALERPGSPIRIVLDFIAEAS